MSIPYPPSFTMKCFEVNLLIFDINEEGSSCREGKLFENPVGDKDTNNEAVGNG
jgi:hypothetical protein